MRTALILLWVFWCRPQLAAIVALSISFCAGLQEITALYSASAGTSAVVCLQFPQPLRVSHVCLYAVQQFGFSGIYCCNTMVVSRCETVLFRRLCGTGTCKFNWMWYVQACESELACCIACCQLAAGGASAMTALHGAVEVLNPTTTQPSKSTGKPQPETQ
jgi:hypothetical protein